MIDYHLHLWPHGQRDRQPCLEELAAYCEQATRCGVEEIALTEHLFRFAQADALLGGFWEEETDPVLSHAMSAYWSEHARADLDEYVEVVQEAKAAGLPVVLGLEVDYYRGRMAEVAELLSGYPFDVLLGSVHWLGAWMFDDTSSAPMMAEWDRVGVERAWDLYTTAIEELAASRTCDVLAHPDLAKVAGRRPSVPDEFHDRIADAAASSGMAAEVSSAGWRKPAQEAYPAVTLLDRFHDRGVPVTTASDAHALPDVAHRSADLRGMLLAAGYDRLRTYRRRRPGTLAIEPVAAAGTG